MLVSSSHGTRQAVGVREIRNRTNEPLTRRLETDE